GICIYQGDQFPAEYQGHVFMGNIHQNAINHDRLIPNGASFKAVAEKDFLTTSDGWFRPISEQVGPDGALWIADWCDKYPCYQNAQADPEGVDREMGRIWRIVWVGDQPGKAVPSRPQPDMNLARLSTEELAGLLDHNNNWQQRQAQRLIAERQDPKLTRTFHYRESKIHQLAKSGRTPAVRLAAIWTLHCAGALEEELMEDFVKDPAPSVRAWVARLIGERGYPFGYSMKQLARLALDKDDSVRLAVATAARQFNSGALTVDTPPSIPLSEVVMGGVLSELQKSPYDKNDPVLPFVIWMALEPLIAFDAAHALDYYRNARDSAESEWPMNPYILTRIMRRVCDLNEPAVREQNLNLAMEILGSVATETKLANAALDGLIASFKSKAAPPTIDLKPIFAKLNANPAIADKSRRLATLLGDTSAARALLAKINDTAASLEERLKGIQA
ncbi:MAG TPA: dehydrogenase, partial [Candidatus Dormibacteraeota bacterium]|nr:dehydrogenase [Candidatus Dormibacteraeota bacterium]